MLNLMLVDDEPLAVEYLAETLIEWDKSELDVSISYSGIQALEKMRELRVDILLTDIRMPGMTGLELADHVLELWPRCKIIFLSGYNDFDYIQDAIRKGGMDYVLKTESDELIFTAIRKAIDEIKAEWQEQSIVANARTMLQQALPTMRREYLFDVLGGDGDSEGGRERRFTELGIELHPSQPVYLVLGRIDDWERYVSMSDKSLMLFSIQNITEEYLSSKCQLLFITYDRFRFVWVIQPKVMEHGTLNGEELHTFVKGSAEAIQTACNKLLKLPISLMLSSNFCDWEDAPKQFNSLKLMQSSGLSRSNEMLISETEPEGESGERSSRAFFAETSFRNHMSKLDLLEAHLDSGAKEPFNQLFMELTELNEGDLSEDKITFLALEMFANLSVFFISYVNRRQLTSELGQRLELAKYTQMESHTSWRTALDYFRHVGETLADYNLNRQQERTNDMIRILHQYIHEFMKEELSLTRLSEVVNLSPQYLSRLYKQLTEVNLVDYITDMRMSKAKQLLKTTNLKIYEIAAEVGFESAPYFTRLFKKLTQRTPQEYRDLALDIH